METAKQEVLHILDTLPSDTTFEEIQYRIYLRQAIERGLQDVDAGRTISQAEVERRLARWIGK